MPFRRAALGLLVASAGAAAGGEPESVFESFRRRVEPIFLKRRPGAARCYDCHSLASHPSLLKLEPIVAGNRWTPRQSRANLERALRLVNPARPLASRLLLHPLAEEAGGDGFHSGGKIWRSRQDAEWRRLAEWVRRAASRQPQN